MLGMRKVKDANDAAREVMTIVNNLSPLDGLEMFAKTGAAFIETCGKLGITTDDLEKAMFNGIHMYRAEVRKQFNSPLRSPKDMAAFEAEIMLLTMTVGGTFRKRMKISCTSEVWTPEMRAWNQIPIGTR